MLTLKNPNLTTNVYSGTFFSRMGFFPCPMWFSSFHSLCFALHMLQEGWGMWRSYGGNDYRPEISPLYLTPFASLLQGRDFRTIIVTY